VQNMTEALLERRLSLIVEHFPLAVLLETVDRKVSQTNQAFCDMFGIPAPPEALVGADCEEAAIQLAPLWGDLDGFLARVHELLDAREPVVGDRVELTDGRILERDFLMVPVDETRGEAAWIYRDVTASETARREAQSEIRARNELLATISHDVRTPVVGIVGLVDILLQQPLDHRTRELVESVHSSAAAMTTMLDDLLDLSRADAGRLELSIEEADICDVVEDVAGMIGPVAQAKSLPLIAGATTAVPDTVRTDPGRLRQVLLNLVSNAVKFSPSGAVTMLADREGSDLVVRVSDTGPGMAPEVVSRAFEEYVQGGAVVNREFGGAGLGLAIANKLTVALGGTIAVESHLGLGSTFTVRIPDAVSGPRHRPSTTGIRAHLSGHHRAVPVVAAALQRQGIEVRDRADDPEVTLEVVVASSVSEAQRIPPSSRRQLILVPAALASCPPLAGTALALPWTRERLLVALRDEWVAPDVPPARADLLPVGTRVLLAEDEPSNRQIISEMLTRLQADVVAVGTGLEAVEALAADRFDVVLMDLAMPVMGGVEAVETIRNRLPADRRPPILALTADARADPTLRPGSGFSGHVPKPVTSAELGRAISAALTAPLAGRPTGSGEPPGIDVGVLQRLAQDIGDAGVVVETLEVYLEELPVRLDAMGAALAHGRFDLLRDEAHSLKSSSRMLGAGVLSDLCRDVEAVTAARSGEGVSTGGDLTPMVDALHFEAFRVAQWLAEYRDAGYPGLDGSASSGA
jgi:signal transduction histidine kinase/CheY-like chemotaxis protein/HPt (histidine-containing phosphotransfer) domain-containing protein